MAKPPRDRFEAASRTYFVSATAAGGRFLLQSDRMAQLFLDTLCGYRDQGKFALHAFVVMPNHVHLLLTPAEDLALERVIQLIKGGFSHAAGELLGRGAEIWQRGYVEHCVRDEDDFERHRAYIHNNPLRRGLVNSPEEYPYSSANPRYQTDPIPQRLKPLAPAATFRHG
jgi:putative transposase